MGGAWPVSASGVYRSLLPNKHTTNKSSFYKSRGSISLFIQGSGMTFGRENGDTEVDIRSSESGWGDGSTVRNRMSRTKYLHVGVRLLFVRMHVYNCVCSCVYSSVREPYKDPFHLRSLPVQCTKITQHGPYLFDENNKLNVSVSGHLED